MNITEYWKTIIGVTLGISLLVFGLVFWNSATEDYYNPVTDQTNKVETCSDYMQYPMFSIGDRDECSQKKKIGGAFLGSGILTLWATIYINKDYLEKIMKDKNLL